MVDQVARIYHLTMLSRSRYRHDNTLKEVRPPHSPPGVCIRVMDLPSYIQMRLVTDGNVYSFIV